MATYLILNLIVIIAICAVLRILPRRPRRAWIAMFIALLILTLVFDNILIWLDMYSYTPEKILGLRVLLAPIEDFMYPILAAIMIPALWNRMGAKHAR